MHINTPWQQENWAASICMWCKSYLKTTLELKDLANFGQYLSNVLLFLSNLDFFFQDLSKFVDPLNSDVVFKYHLHHI